MRVDQHREHAACLVRLDEPHSAHIGGQVVDGVGARDGLVARIGAPEIEHDVLGIVGELVPVLEWVLIHRPYGVTLLDQSVHQVPADETTATRHHDQLV